MSATQLEINQVIRKLEKTVTVFASRDRKSLLTKAAAPVRKAMRNKTKVGTRVHYRYRGTQKIFYQPGNLRKSMRTLTKLKRSSSVFVGPDFGRGAGRYDGYYYAMAYGSIGAYLSQVRNPAQRESEQAAIKAFETLFIKKFGTRAAQQGLDAR